MSNLVGKNYTLAELFDAKQHRQTNNLYINHKERLFISVGTSTTSTTDPTTTTSKHFF